MQPVRTRLAAPYVAIVAMCVALSTPPAAHAQTRISAATPPFAPTRVVPPFPAIVDAPFIRGDEVDEEVTAKELVLGVVVNGEARAYPINMLTGPSREIINDHLGGRAIAATW